MLAAQKAVRVQLKSYCMGMKQLMSLKKYKDASGEDEELALIERMKSTIGVAVGNMETAIKSGALWCPSQEENIAESSFLGMVSFISFDLAARREHDHVPGLVSTPAYTTAPPANSAASAKQIRRIFPFSTLFSGKQNLGIIISGMLT